MSLISTLFVTSGFDYNIDNRNRISTSSLLTSPIMEEVREFQINETVLNTQSAFLLDYISSSNIYSLIANILKDSFDSHKIRSNVYKTAFDIVNRLPESVLSKIDTEDIYPTNYGTIVLDWNYNNSDDEFSLEIGDSCFGYFSEYDGSDIVRVDEVEFSTQNISQLHSDIEEFYKR